MTSHRTSSRAEFLARLLLILGIAAALAACSGSSSPLSDQAAFSGGASSAATPGASPATIKPTAQGAQQVNALFARYAVPEQDAAAGDYRLAPMDVVDVTVYDAPNLSRAAQVGAGGNITLPLVGDIRATGKTTDQLQKDIAARLGKDFMQSPQVFVTVKEYNSQRVTVDGAVMKPGVFPLKGKTTLVEAIAQAGGLNPMGSASGVFVLRQVDGKKMVARFDLNEIRKGQKEDPVMRAGDIVMVDESSGKVMFKNLQSVTGFTGIFSLLLL